MSRKFSYDTRIPVFKQVRRQLANNKSAPFLNGLGVGEFRHTCQRVSVEVEN